MSTKEIQELDITWDEPQNFNEEAAVIEASEEKEQKDTAIAKKEIPVKKQVQKEIKEEIKEENKEEEESVEEEDEITESEVIGSFLSKFGLIDEEEDVKNLSSVEMKIRFEDEILTKAEQLLNSKIKNQSIEAQNIITSLLSGEDFNDILEQITEANTQDISPNMDLDSEKNQIKFLKHILKAEGEDDEYIEDQIEIWKEKDKLESIASKKFDRWKRNYNQHQQNLYQNQQRKIQENRNKAIAFYKEVKEEVESLDTLQGIKLTKEEKQNLPSYIAQVNEYDDGTTMTQLNRDLLLAMRDPLKMITIAKLAQENFDLKRIGQHYETKAVKKIKKDFQRQKNTEIGEDEKQALNISWN